MLPPQHRNSLHRTVNKCGNLFKLSPCTRYFLFELLMNPDVGFGADLTEWCDERQKTFCNLMGVSRRTITRAESALVELGILEKEEIWSLEHGMKVGRKIRIGDTFMDNFIESLKQESKDA
jgi:hypothetical protein